MSSKSTLDKLLEYDTIIDAFYEEPGKKRIIAIVDFITSIERLPKEIDGVPVLFKIGHNNLRDK